ncbi:MAG: TRAP transporter small permease [Lachnospiraceae bacterium]|nr:TRAP transporter small permease [Lachnospiraceae bacterium]
MKKAIDWLQKIQIAVGGFFLSVFLITVVLQMGCRYAGIAATWTEDVAMYSFIWAVFMGAGAMVYEKRHFAFTSISDMMKNERVKSILAVIISLIMLYFAVLMIYYGYKVTKQFWNYTWVNIPKLKRGPTWLCLPICGVTSTIYLVQQIIEEVGSIAKGGKN